MNRALKERIKEQAENCCQICGNWCGDTGSPHHINKVSEAPILEDCKMNVKWTCFKCHRRTEDEPGYNKQLQIELQHEYESMFEQDKYYNKEQLSEMVGISVKDIEKAMKKAFLKWRYISSNQLFRGEDIIRFLCGGKLHDTRNRPR